MTPSQLCSMLRDSHNSLFNLLAYLTETTTEAKMSKIEIYTAMACPYCRRALRLLSSKRIFFEEIDVTLNSIKRQAMRDRTNGLTSVPQIFVNNNHIGGCDDLFRLDQAGHLDKLLSIAS